MRPLAYVVAVAWEIELTEQAQSWFGNLGQRDASRIAASLDELQRSGPGLGRPFVDSVKGSRHHHMKELRSVGGNLRMLFASDPQRRAIVLIGGDKTNDWRGWYARNIPLADRLYDKHLRSLGDNQAWPTLRTGERSATSER